MWIKIKLINGRWKADLVKDFKIMDQLRRESGLGDGSDSPGAYDRLLSTAGKYGLGLETDWDE